MNRAEMILELWNNPNKVFRDEDNQFEYYVDDMQMRMNHLDTGRINRLWMGNINYDKHYYEVLQPLWETIKDGNEYYTPSLQSHRLYDSTYFESESSYDRNCRERHLMFRTKEEAIELSERILESL